MLLESPILTVMLFPSKSSVFFRMSRSMIWVMAIPNGMQMELEKIVLLSYRNDQEI
jgi:hypothetical protein